MALRACIACGRRSQGRRCPRCRLPSRPQGKAWQATRQRVLARDGWKCLDCGTPLTDVYRLPNTAHVAHRTPRAAGGSNDESNLYASCAECNERLNVRSA